MDRHLDLERKDGQDKEWEEITTKRQKQKERDREKE